jgi:hypothetical protein
MIPWLFDPQHPVIGIPVVVFSRTSEQSDVKPPNVVIKREERLVVFQIAT